MLCVAWGIAVAAAGLKPIGLHAQQTFAQFQQLAVVDALRAELDPTTNMRVARIWWQLAQYSGRVYRVVPAQQFTIGQALPYGVILLDLSTAGNEHPEVTAFFLAHEWGHQVLGHVGLNVGQMYAITAAFGPTATEDAADRYAAQFVKRAGYDTAPIYSFLCSLPGGGDGDSHSSGPARARIVQGVIRDVSGNVCAGDNTDSNTDNNADSNSGGGTDDNSFAAALRRLMAAAPGHFSSVRGAYLDVSDGDREYEVTVTPPGFSYCKLQVDSSIQRYDVMCRAADGTSYRDVVDAVSKVAGNDGEDRESQYVANSHVWTTDNAHLQVGETNRGSVYLHVRAND